MSTADRLRAKCEALTELLLAKNKAYGDSALNPIRIFSTANPQEQLRIRIDDKLSRIARGSEFPGDDTLLDLAGYLILLSVATDNATAPTDGHS